jgi:hypothetical protein
LHISPERRSWSWKQSMKSSSYFLLSVNLELQQQKMHVSNSHCTAQLSGATSGQLIYHTNTAHSATPPKCKAKYQWEVTNDKCQIKRGPCTNTMLLGLWAQNMKTIIYWEVMSYHLWISVSKVHVCVCD